MTAPDLEVIKDIPGYKVILKAVLKTQIQQLVEHLATHTDEESVILTASVADGTISHLGSDSGKGFLEEQEDVKTQFLGFCLKKHHKKLQEEKEKERQKAALPLPGQFDMGPGPRRPRLPFHSGPRQSFSAQGYRSPSNRHEPYHIPRPARRSSTDVSFTDPSQTSPFMGQSGDESSDNIPLKTEPGNDSEISDTVNRLEDNTNSSLDNTGSGDNELVKLEALSESEFELEITGVEPGRIDEPQNSSNWNPNVSLGMNMDLSQGATGGTGEAGTQQGYTPLFAASVNPNRVCNYCQKVFSSPFAQRRHMLIHTGEMPFKCNTCNKRFNQKAHLQVHQVTHTNLSDL